MFEGAGICKRRKLDQGRKKQPRSKGVFAVPLQDGRIGRPFSRSRGLFGDRRLLQLDGELGFAWLWYWRHFEEVLMLGQNGKWRTRKEGEGGGAKGRKPEKRQESGRQGSVCAINWLETQVDRRKKCKKKRGIKPLDFWGRICARSCRRKRSRTTEMGQKRRSFQKPSPTQPTAQNMRLTTSQTVWPAVTPSSFAQS